MTNKLSLRRTQDTVNQTGLSPEHLRFLTEDTYFAGELVQYQELMMMYNCAIHEVRTKLEVLNADLSVRYQRNPIEFISYRIKKPASLIRKMKSRGIPVTVSAIEGNIHDVAGVRVICSFIDDIYVVAEMLTCQDDITLVQTKDYIKNPKDNGYRSLHLLIDIPVFFSDQKKTMRVEVQIRTIAMDFWANLEHQIKYKHVIQNEEEISAELKDCAETIAATDRKMMSIRDKIEAGKTEDPLDEDLLERLAGFRIPTA